MKKFSSFSGEKVNQEPEVKLAKEQLEKKALKASIMKLMDNYLQIRSNGSVRKELYNNSITIAGKEMVAEALIDLLSDKTYLDQIKALESLKSDNTDWISIDNKINQISEKIVENNSIDKIQVKKIKSFLDTYSNDKSFETILEKYVSRIKSSDEANLRSVTAQKMMMSDKWTYSKNQLQLISEKFSVKSKELSNANGSTE
jgi:hypothetical protein